MAAALNLPPDVRAAYLAMSPPEQASFRARVIHDVALRRLAHLARVLAALEERIFKHAEKLIDLADERDALLEKLDAADALRREALDHVVRAHDVQNELEQDRADFPPDQAEPPPDPIYAASPF